jgi:hypothetical protein
MYRPVVMFIWNRSVGQPTNTFDRCRNQWLSHWIGGMNDEKRKVVRLQKGSFEIKLHWSIHSLPILVIPGYRSSPAHSIRKMEES